MRSKGTTPSTRALSFSRRLVRAKNSSFIAVLLLFYDYILSLAIISMISFPATGDPDREAFWLSHLDLNGD